jgi:CelD/BcsL family acetyltransferase involved in cellulose biosynthesis
MKIDILTGKEAERLIKDEVFLGEWRELYERCNWGSVYQSEDFVLTWYECYRSKYVPLIVTGISPEGRLIGLFTLATQSETGRIVVAGDSHAEYQSWLSDSQYSDEFIKSTLDSLSNKYRGRSLTLLFMLPNVPVKWAVTDQRWSKRCHVRTLPRGLMQVGNGESFKETLRKKKQSKINRLKRLGNLRLDRINDPEEFGAIFDEMMRYQALRLKAVYNLTELQEDREIKSFYLNLLRRPRVIHATALRVDDNLVSAQIHMYNREQVLLGRITHSPFFARYSPGELHILMTGIELAKESIPVFDLTPGGDYKDRYATHYDEVYVVTAFFSRAQCIVYKTKRRIAEGFKSIIGYLAITPATARDKYSSLLDQWHKWKGLKLSDLVAAGLKKLKTKLWETTELRVYTCDFDQITESSGNSTLMRNNLSDLLAYRPLRAWQPSVNNFMKQALKNLEAGHHVYTRIEDNKLTQYAWMMESQNLKSLFIDGQNIVLAADSVLLTDFYTRSEGPVPTQSALNQLLRDAIKVPNAQRAYILVSRENRQLEELAIKSGFIYQNSFFNKNILGKKVGG